MTASYDPGGGHGSAKALLDSILKYVDKKLERDSLWYATVVAVSSLDGMVKVKRPGQSLPDDAYYPMLGGSMALVGDDVLMATAKGGVTQCLGAFFTESGVPSGSNFVGTVSHIWGMTTDGAAHINPSLFMWDNSGWGGMPSGDYTEPCNGHIDVTLSSGVVVTAEAIGCFPFPVIGDKVAVQATNGCYRVTAIAAPAFPFEHFYDAVSAVPTLIPNTGASVVISTKGGTYSGLQTLPAGFYRFELTAEWRSSTTIAEANPATHSLSTQPALVDSAGANRWSINDSSDSQEGFASNALPAESARGPLTFRGEFSKLEATYTNEPWRLGLGCNVVGAATRPAYKVRIMGGVIHRIGFPHNHTKAHSFDVGRGAPVACHGVV